MFQDENGLFEGAISELVNNFISSITELFQNFFLEFFSGIFG